MTTIDVGEYHNPVAVDIFTLAKAANKAGQDTEELRVETFPVMEETTTDDRQGNVSKTKINCVPPQ